MTQPKLLLLDEPSSGLDVRETAALAERLAKRAGGARVRGAARRARRRDGPEPRHPAVRARLRHAHRVGRRPTTCSATKPSARPISGTSYERRSRPARRASADPAPTARRCSSSATSRRATGRSARCSGCRSRCASTVLALLGVERLGQDDRRARLLRAREADRRIAPVRGRGHHRAARVPARTDGHRPRTRGSLGVRLADGRGEPRAHVPPGVRPPRRRRARSTRGLRPVPAPRRAAPPGTPARCRAASSGCCRSRACWCARRSC